MYSDINEEQRMLQAKIKDFARKEAAPLNAQMDKEGFPHELFDKIKETGFLGIPFPEAYGGGGGDAITSALAIYELAKASPSVSMTLNAHWLAADTILNHGTEEQKKKYIPMASADTLFAFSLSEPSAGSDAAGIQTTAVLEKEEYVLNGTKAWCTNGGVAGVYVILAKTDTEKGARGISAFLADESNPGLRIGRIEDKMGMRGSQTTKLFLDNCRVPKADLLGNVGDGFKIAMIALDGARISIGAASAGIAETAMNCARDYANKRQAFGGPIANFQSVQHIISDMAIGLEATKLMTFHAARMKKDGLRHTKEAAMVKVFGAEHAVHCALECIQITGGSGYSKEYPGDQLLRDAKLLEIGEGSRDVLRTLIGKSVLAGR